MQVESRDRGRKCSSLERGKRKKTAELWRRRMFLYVGDAVSELDKPER
jgi:hypothetical protein